MKDLHAYDLAVYKVLGALLCRPYKPIGSPWKANKNHGFGR